MGKKPLYVDPEPRTFPEWCKDLGLTCKGNCPLGNEKLTFYEFCFYPEVKLYKVSDGLLYGFWKNYEEFWVSRTVKDWLDDLDFELVNPTESELSDLNLFIDYDGFWDWSSGIVTDKYPPKSTPGF
jgi:hypothetical protein